MSAWLSEAPDKSPGRSRTTTTFQPSSWGPPQPKHNAHMQACCTVHRPQRIPLLPPNVREQSLNSARGTFRQTSRRTSKWSSQTSHSSHWLYLTQLKIEQVSSFKRAVQAVMPLPTKSDSACSGTDTVHKVLHQLQHGAKSVLGVDIPHQQMWACAIAMDTVTVLQAQRLDIAVCYEDTRDLTRPRLPDMFDRQHRCWWW